MLQSILQENHRCNISRYIHKEGIQLFQATQKIGLEGIVAKHINSYYYPGKRTNDWIKCKHLLDDDFIIVGYIIKEKGYISFILAQYDQHQQLQYKGHVTLGTSLTLLKNTKKTTICPFSNIPPNHSQAIWITPFLVCIVQFMQYTENGGLRQPVCKGIRQDKTPQECIQKDK